MSTRAGAGGRVLIIIKNWRNLVFCFSAKIRVATVDSWIKFSVAESFKVKYVVLFHLSCNFFLISRCIFRLYICVI